MFVVVNIVSSGKRKIRHGKTVDKVHEVKTGHGERFYIVDVLDSAKGVNWDEVAYFIGGYGKSVLISDSICFPDFCLLKKFDSSEFCCIMIFNTVSAILKQLYLSGMRISCCINDPEGKYASFLDKIVRFASETAVVTANDYRYFSESEKLYSYLGASVSITDKSSSVNSCDIIIDTTDKIEYSGCGTLFSPFGKGFNPYYVDNFNDLKSICPSYINTVDFFGAMYKMNRESRLRDAMCRVFSCEGENISTADLYEKIFRNRSKNDVINKPIIFCV